MLFARTAAARPENIESGYLTRMGTYCCALSFTQAPSPLVCTSWVASFMIPMCGVPSPPSAPPEHATKSGMAHVFSSSAATLDPSAKNQPCFNCSVSPPPGVGVAAVSSSRGNPIWRVHSPIISAMGWREASSHAAHRSPVVALPYLNSCM